MILINCTSFIIQTSMIHSKQSVPINFQTNMDIIRVRHFHCIKINSVQHKDHLCLIYTIYNIYISQCIIFPVQHLLPVLVLSCILHLLVLGLHEPVPLSPLRMLGLLVLLFVGVPRLEGQQFVQVSQEIDKQPALQPSLHKVLQLELHAAGRLHQVDPGITISVHLAHNVLEVEIVAAPFHVGQSLALLLVEKLKLVSRYHSISVQVQNAEPVLDALLRCFVLHAVDKPAKIPKAHFLWVLKLACNL